MKTKILVPTMLAGYACLIFATASLAQTDDYQKGQKSVFHPVMSQEKGGTAGLWTGTLLSSGSTQYDEVEDYTINLTPAATSNTWNTWVGVTSTDWYDGSNWSLGTIPNEDVHANIPGGTLFAPTIGSGTARCKNLVLTGNQVLTQSGTSYFYVHGNFDSDAGQFIQTGTSYLYLAGSTDTWWDDDNENDVYRYVRVLKDTPTARLLMWQDMTVGVDFHVRRGDFRINAQWTLTVEGLSSTAFRVENEGTVTIVDEHLDIAGGIRFLNGSQASVSGGTISCGGNFVVDANTLYDIVLAGGTLIMNGSAAQYIRDEDGGTMQLNNLTINKSGGVCYIGNANLDVNGNLTISGGTLSCNNAPTPTATYNINVAGNWTNNIGPANFVESTGRVTFDGSGIQYVNSSETFNILEVNNGSALRVTMAAYTVTCNTYDWTSGGIDMIAGTFTALDLADNGLFGGYWVNPGATINLYQDAGQFVDLNGTIWMSGGNMNVHGGNGASYWSFGGNASVTMSGGTLDFKDVGIYVYNSGAYIFTENITDGIIRTAGYVNTARSEFTPTGGIVEMYGTADVPVSQSNGATFYNLTINKSAKEGNPGPSTPTYEERGGEKVFVGGGSKANTVTPNTNITVTNNLEVTDGTLSLNTHTFAVAKTANITGTLSMASGNFNVGTVSYDNLRFLSGSTGNVTGGAINLKSWFFAESGSSFTTSAANTMTFTGNQVTGMDVRSAAVLFGNVVVNKTVVYHVLFSAVPNVIVGGSFALQGTSEFQMQGYSMHVQGLFTDASGTKIYLDLSDKSGEMVSADGAASGSGAKGGSLEIDSDFTLTGLMDLKTSGNVLVHGSFGITSSGVLTIHGASSFIVDLNYKNSDAWQNLYGTINMTGGLFEISYHSMRFGSTSVNNISGGIMRCGLTFIAASPNVFQPTGGVVEFVSNISGVPLLTCGNGNYFHDLTINRGALIQVGSAIEVRRDMLIQSGPLYTNNNNIKVGRNWTNSGGSDAFIEGTSTVTFFGALSGDITTAETFYNLILDKTYTGFDGLEIMSVPVTVLNNLNITDGTLELNSNTVLTVGNNVDIALNAGLNAGGTDTNIELYVGGNWTNNNTTYNTIAGYTPGGETITFNGATDQVMTTAAAIEEFNYFVVSKPGGALKPSGSLQILGNFDIFAGNFSSNTSGLTHYFHRNFTMHGPGSYYPGTNSTTVFKGALDQTYERLGGSGNFRNVVVDKTAGKSSDLVEVIGGESIEKIEDTDGSKALTVNLLTTIVAFSGGTTTIEEGTLNLNGVNYKSTGALNINAGGKVAVPAGSYLYPNGGLFINNGGILETIGTAGSNANVCHDGASAYFPFEVNAGGTISAVHTTFRHMNANGIFIKEGAVVDATHSFHNCTFELGAPAISTLMLIHNNQTFSVNNAVFPTNTWGGTYNVWKMVDNGHVTFNNATGGFAGPTYENDPYNRIDWPGFTPGLWTGTISANWFTPGNWGDGNVPVAGTNVVIPAGCPFFPVVSGAAAVCNDMDINTGASLTIGNNTLTAAGTVDINGHLVMTNAAAVLNADQIWWNDGSSADVTAGTFNANDWMFREGTTAKLGTGNTAYIKTLYYPTDDDAEFGNLVVVPSTDFKQDPSKAFYPTIVAGDFTLQTGSAWGMSHGLIVNGNVVIHSGSLLHMNMFSNLTVGGAMNLAGGLAINYGTALLSGDLSFPETGTLDLNNGSFTCNYSLETGWMILAGTLNMTGASAALEINGRNVKIASTFIDDNISAGVIRFGRTLSATSANVFQLSGVPVEFIGPNGGHYIQLTNGNYLDDMIIHKTGAYITLTHDITVNGNLTIQDGELLASDRTVTLGGNWNNTLGPAAFSEGTSTVIFSGAADQTSSPEVFYNLHLNKATGQLVIPAASNVTCASYNWIAGGITVTGGAFNADDLAQSGVYGSFTMTGGVINLYQDPGQWPDLNATLNISGGTLLIKGGSGTSFWGVANPITVTLSGSGVINFADNGVYIAPTSPFTENITGGTIRTNRNFNAQSADFTPSGGTVEMYGGATAYVTTQNGASFNNLAINKSGGDGESFQFVTREGTLEEGSKANDVFASGSVDVSSALSLNAGALILQGQTASVTGNVQINSGGILTVDANANLLMGNNATLAVNNGGTLNVLGDAGLPATVSRITGNYIFDIFSGAAIAAEHAIFEYMNTAGVNVKPGAHVDPAKSFTNCIFRNGQSGGRLITLNNNQTLLLSNVSFQGSSGNFNVSKTVDEGVVVLTDYSGGFAGASWEQDDHNRIHWTGEPSAEISLDGIAVGAGQDLCFEAQQTIVTGGAQNFVVVSTGAVNLVAGESILMLPGTHAHSGSYLHAQISDVSFCSGLPLALVAAITEDPDQHNWQEMNEVKTNEGFIKVYPNPARDIIMLELTPPVKDGHVVIEVYNLMGQNFMSKRMEAKPQYQLDLTGLQSGVYLIKLTHGKTPAFTKLIKQ